MQTRTTVIKIGGALLKAPEILSAFWPALQALSAQERVVIVHGGGPQSTAMARRLGHEPTIVNGRRVTTDIDLSILQWTICGELNAYLVAEGFKYGLPTVGLRGIDGGTLRVNRRPPWTIDGRQVDFGWVGDVDHINPRLLQTLLAAGLMPIMAPLGIDKAGQTYNVNADTVAHAVAVALQADALLLVTESGGVRRMASDSSTRIQSMDKELFAAGKTDGWIKDGMLVKLKMAFEAREAGISDVFILPPDDIFSRTAGTAVV